VLDFQSAFAKHERASSSKMLETIKVFFILGTPVFQFERGEPASTKTRGKDPLNSQSAPNF
jgi:hypothetical protein